MQLQITLHTDEDGVWITERPAIPGYVLQGDTRETATENVRDAIRECLIVHANKGMPPTIETRQVEVAV